MTPDPVTSMCTDEDDEVFECEESPGAVDDSKRHALAALNSPASTNEKVTLYFSFYKSELLLTSLYL